MSEGSLLSTTLFNIYMDTLSACVNSQMLQTYSNPNELGAKVNWDLIMYSDVVKIQA